MPIPDDTFIRLATEVIVGPEGTEMSEVFDYFGFSRKQLLAFRDKLEQEVKQELRVQFALHATDNDIQNLVCNEPSAAMPRNRQAARWLHADRMLKEMGK